MKFNDVEKDELDKRIENHRIEFEIISKIDLDNLIELEVINVSKYDYKLKYENSYCWSR